MEKSGLERGRLGHKYACAHTDRVLPRDDNHNTGPLNSSTAHESTPVSPTPHPQPPPTKTTTQYGKECFCGDSEKASDYKVNGGGKCDRPCSGDGSVVCGGFWSLLLYKYADEEEGDSPDSPSGGMYGTTYSGDATYYGYTTGGNCAYKGNVPGMYDGMIPSEKRQKRETENNDSVKVLCKLGSERTLGGSRVL